MSGARVVQIDGSRAVVITPCGGAVRLEVVMNLPGVQMKAFSHVLTRAQARELGDALGFASNDAAPAGCNFNCDQGRRCTCGARA